MAQLVECHGRGAVSCLTARGMTVVSMNKALYPLLSFCSTQEDLSRHDLKIVDWDVKNQTKHTNKITLYMKQEFILLSDIKFLCF